MSINENRSVICKECGSHAVWVEDGFSATTYEGLHIGQPECECQCECEGTLVVEDDEQPALWFKPNNFPVDVIEVRGPGSWETPHCSECMDTNYVPPSPGALAKLYAGLRSAKQ